jgi:hypothetical protein
MERTAQQNELRNCLITTIGPFFADADRAIGKPAEAADAIIAMLSCRDFNIEPAKR